MSSRTLLALTLVLGAGCADFSRGEPTPHLDAAPEAADGDGGALPTFAGSIHTLLLMNCGGCHEAGKQAGGSSYILNGDPTADGLAVRALVDTSNPAASRLLSKAAGTGHSGGTIFATDSPEYAMLLAWIQGGAP
jgi:hypothetical protein